MKVLKNNIVKHYSSNGERFKYLTQKKSLRTSRKLMDIVNVLYKRHQILKFNFWSNLKKPKKMISNRSGRSYRITRIVYASLLKRTQI